MSQKFSHFHERAHFKGHMLKPTQAPATTVNRNPARFVELAAEAPFSSPEILGLFRG